MENQNLKIKEMKPCPLCGTMLLYDKWLKVVGVYEEQQKYRKQLEVELTKAKEQEKKLKEEYQKIRQKEKEIRHRYALEKLKLKQKFQIEQENFRKKLERQKQTELGQALRKGLIAGIEKQKSRMEKVIQMAEKARKERDKAMERVKQLEEMLKKGTTPQIEGFDFEHELANQLKQKFPEDEIKPTGHQKGDIIQTIKVETKKVGKILYECKKTKEFENKFIEQIRRDKIRVVADYGVIVTWATKEDNQNFWIDGDIIIVHPYGVLGIVAFLRETLIQMYSLKLSKTEFETKGKAILEFMQSEEFRTRIQNSIAKSREAYESLKKEMTTHFNIWKKRATIYESIYKNTNIIQNMVKYILLHGKIPENLPEIEVLPPLQISPQKEESQGEEGNVKDIPF
jgi:hypothetical protein